MCLVGESAGHSIAIMKDLIVLQLAAKTKVRAGQMNIPFVQISAHNFCLVSSVLQVFII